MVFGVSYAVVLYTKVGERENLIQTGAILFSYNENSNGISITNAYAMDDESGKVIPATGEDIAQGYFDFVVAARIGDNKSVLYEVYATDVTDGARKIDPKYIKVYITDGTDDRESAMPGYQEIVPVYSQLANSNGGKRLYSGTFASSGSQKFRLRIWLASDYPTSGITEAFKMKVNVAASA